VPSEEKTAAISSAVKKNTEVHADSEPPADLPEVSVAPDITTLKVIMAGLIQVFVLTCNSSQLSFAQSLDSRDSIPTVKADEFEKDDDSNFHIDFIHALTNLRARNYGLEEYDWLQVHSIALSYFHLDIDRSERR
jgi:hypothetical protein